MADDWRKRCGNKLVDMKSAIGLIRRGDHIYIGGGAGTPTAMLYELVEQRNSLAGHEIVHVLTLGPAPHVAPELKHVFRHNALFIGSNTREAVRQGHADYTPIFLSEIPPMIRRGRIPVDVTIVTVSPPDRNGFCSLGVDVAANRAAIGACSVLLAEVNVQMPRTCGNTFVHVDRINALVETDRPLPELNIPAGDEVADRIGRYVADLVEDGATLQIGIGTIPEAVLSHLTEKHDLGIHSEMLSDGMILLIERGVVNCRRKTLHRGKAVVSFVMGTRRLYDFVADHPLMEFHPCDYTNDPFVIAQNDRMVAINTALEVDLTGQVCADSIGAQFYSGIGGQVDFIRGAARSRGGRPVIALPSTALDGSASRIVPHLSEGAGVVTTRGDVHYVVTEYGVAQLHGKTVRERALALIHIAHPNFRPWLLAEAKRHNFIYRERKDVPVKVSLYPDRFEKHYRLKSGAAVFVRPVKPTDENRVNDLFYGLSEDSVYQRFFATCRFFSRSQIQDLCSPDYDRDMAIVACLPTDESEDEQIVGMGVYSLNPATGFADVSFLVAEAMQGQGIGSLLMEHILKVARRQGVHGFTADVLANNSRMLHIFQKCGFPTETLLADGIYQVRIPFEESGAKQAADEVAAADQPPKPPSSANTRSAPTTRG